MSRLRAFCFLVLSVLLSAFAAACVAPEEDEDEDTSEIEAELGQGASVFGDDRVGRALKTRPDLVPTTYEEYEKVFQVGRECGRKDSKEIFIVEETATRTEGHKRATGRLLPRAVVTGCNTGDKNNESSLRRSYSLLTALISDPEAPKPADPMIFEGVEAMALDDTTGLYNFYVFLPTAPGRAGKVVRIVRKDDGKVVKIERGPDKKARMSKAEVNPCFSCHVDGGPIMNELSDPWMHWVSFKKTLPKAKLAGETLSLVREAAPDLNKQGRASLAGDLERIMRAAQAEWVEGDGKTKGFGPRTLGRAGGAEKLLESVFCETELNFASSSESTPLELFLDPDAADLASISAPPTRDGVDVFQMPIRSIHDQRVERFLVKKGHLTPQLAAAIRLVDDERDVFSNARCRLYPEVKNALRTNDAGATRAAITKVMRSRLAAGTLFAPGRHSRRAAFVDALLDPAKGAKIADAQKAYAAELQDRTQTLFAMQSTIVGQRALAKEQTERKQRALAMFPDDANPLPLLSRR